MDNLRAYSEYNYNRGWTIKFNPKRKPDANGELVWDELTGFTDEFWVDYLVSALNNWHLTEEQQSKYGVPKL